MYRVLEVNVDDRFYGGVYVLVRSIIQHLPKEITADIAALEPFEKEEHKEELNRYGTNVYYVGSECNKLLKQYRIYRNMRKLISEKKYDVIHFHSDVSHKILISALAAKKEGVQKLIFHAHANDVEGRFYQLRRFLHQICCKKLKTIPAKYIATSDEAGKWMFPWAKKDEIEIIINGIDYKKFEYNEKARKTVREELHIGNELLLGSVGRFVYQKNPLYLLDILNEATKRNLQTKLLHIGEGPLENEFKQKAKMFGLENELIMLKTTDSIERFYQAMDVVLLPSNFEGFGLVAVEAQASNTPVIVSEYVPGITKISDLITYLPIGQDNVDLWVETVLHNCQHKKEVTKGIDHNYDIKRMTDNIAEIYRA